MENKNFQVLPTQGLFYIDAEGAIDKMVGFVIVPDPEAIHRYDFLCYPITCMGFVLDAIGDDNSVVTDHLNEGSFLFDVVKKFYEEEEGQSVYNACKRIGLPIYKDGHLVE